MPLVSGRVLDTAGGPVADARVMFADAPVPVPDVAAVTDAEGRFALTAPAAGRYALVAAADGRENAQLTVDVPGAEPVEVELILREATA
jgi:hypothetical protein